MNLKIQGICDLSEAQEYYYTSTLTTPTKPTTTTTTTTAAPTTKKASVRDRALIAHIQRCIQTPKYCNTNLVFAASASKKPKKGQ